MAAVAECIDCEDAEVESEGELALEDLLKIINLSV